MRLLSCLFIIIFLCGCEDKESINNPEETLIDGVNLLWTTELSDGSDYIIKATQFPEFDGTIIFPGIKNNLSFLNGIDINTGEILWEKENIGNLFSGIKNHSFQENVYLRGIEEHRSINIKTGLDNWALNYGDLPVTGNNFGLEEQLYVIQAIYDEDGTFTPCIYNGNLKNTNAFEFIVCPNYSLDYAMATGLYGSVGTIHPFVENGDTLFFIGFTDATPVNQTIPFWGIYNQTQKQWEIEKITVEVAQFGGFGHSIYYYQNKFYFTADRRIFCFDRYSGQEIWHKEFDLTFTFSGILMVEEHNILIGTNENGQTYGLNPDNGNIIWQTTTGGNGSPMHYQENVIYFTSGGNGKLYAIDILTGELLWEVNSPEIEQDDFAIFTSQINGIPSQNGEKGKIFVSSYLSAYCFEAVN